MCLLLQLYVFAHAWEFAKMILSLERSFEFLLLIFIICSFIFIIYSLYLLYVVFIAIYFCKTFD